MQTAIQLFISHTIIKTRIFVTWYCSRPFRVRGQGRTPSRCDGSLNSCTLLWRCIGQSETVTPFLLFGLGICLPLVIGSWRRRGSVQLPASCGSSIRATFWPVGTRNKGEDKEGFVYGVFFGNICGSVCSSEQFIKCNSFKRPNKIKEAVYEIEFRGVFLVVSPPPPRYSLRGRSPIKGPGTVHFNYKLHIFTCLWRFLF
jgi:hypothetical protein